MTDTIIDTNQKWLEVERVEVQQSSSPNQNFGLSKSQFDTIVYELKQGNESLFEKIFLSHFEDCTIYLKNSYKAPYEIAYDITMDTMIEFRYKLLTDKISYGNLRYLFTKMAGQLYLKSIAKDNKVKESIFESTEEIDDYEDKILALKGAWAGLSPDDKKLLENFYYLDIPLNKMAEVENKSDAALRKQKQRAVDKLRQIFFSVYNKL
jgi:hypothetical protein